MQKAEQKQVYDPTLFHERTSVDYKKYHSSWNSSLQVLVDYTPYIPGRPRGRPPGGSKNRHSRKPLIVTKKDKVGRYVYYPKKILST